MANSIESVCRCGRTYLGHAALCPICIAEAITGREVGQLTEKEHAVALILFREMANVVGMVHSATTQGVPAKDPESVRRLIEYAKQGSMEANEVVEELLAQQRSRDREILSLAREIWNHLLKEID